MLFKKGDTIECLCNEYGCLCNITVGSTYKVARDQSYAGNSIYLVQDDRGNKEVSYAPKRFKLAAVSAVPQARITYPFKLHDDITCVSTDGSNKGNYTIGVTYRVIGIVTGSGNARIIGNNGNEWIVSNSDFQLEHRYSDITGHSGDILIQDDCPEDCLDAGTYSHDPVTPKSYRPKEAANAEVDNLKQYRYTPEIF